MDLFFGGWLSFWFLAAAVPIGLLVLGIVAVAGVRREPDPTGGRAMASYFGLVMFLALFAVLLAGTAAVGQVASFIVPADDRHDEHLEGGWFSYGPGDGVRFEPGRGRFDEFPDGLACPECEEEADDRATRRAVAAGLVFLPAAAVLLFHRPRRRAMVEAPDFVGSPAWRADRTFLHVVCVVALVLAVIASATAVYDVFRMIAPDITTGYGGRRSERERAAADLLTMGVLAAGSLAVFAAHWSQVSGEVNPLRRLRPGRRGRPAVREESGG